MKLGDLIAELGKHDPNKIVKSGFSHPHSYRGYYERLAFEPAEGVTVGSMLSWALQANGATYTGYKGGEYVMGEYSDCYLAEYGNCGEELGPRLLAYILAEILEV